MPFRSIDPATGRLLRDFDAHSIEEALEATDRAAAALSDWQATSIDERVEVLGRAGDLLRREGETLARTMVEEMGKPIAQARSEIEKCALLCDVYAAEGPGHLASEPAETAAAKSYAAWRPIGLVLGVMPWNFPFWQFFRYAVPNLLGGNGTVLKHAPNVPACAEAMVTLIREAGAGAVVQNLRLEVEDVPALMDHPAIRGVTLTGSVRAGRAVAAEAGARLLKTVLELGGSDAYLILEDADLDHAIEQCATSRLLNGGQTCIAAKRLIVVDAVHDRFVAGLERRLCEVEMGDPTADVTRLGPMARVDLRDQLHAQVERAVAEGATLVFGGEIPDRQGAWYPVTLLTDVDPGSIAGQEELFGPVACVIRASDEEDAIRIANDSPYGLGAAVYTEDRERGERIARDRLDAGACFVNAFVRSDPRLPFGGVKASGYGRELGRLGVQEFLNAKAVWID